MAFVPGYDQDVFISYAHVDDEPLVAASGADQSAGWVATFVRLLKKELAQKIGRSENFAVWFDQINLRGNHSITPEITTKLERTATFVGISSVPYGASQWCRDEARLFSQHFADDLAGRVFVVEKEPLAEKPPQLAGLKNYKFWHLDDKEQPRTLGKPVPLPAEREYFSLIEDLARDIQGQLKAMAGRPRANGGNGAGVAFLAEVTDDLEFRRLEVRRYLEQKGVLVLPEASLPLGRAQFEAALDADLARGQVFVQLLGPIPGKMPPDVPDGYGWLQVDLARRHRMSVLQWRNPELDLIDIEWPRHRELLALDTVQATSL